jgi:hypothetical protein
MATFTQIRSVRLIVQDPSGVIDLVSVADPAALPVTSAPQTAYKVLSTGGYVIWNGAAYVPVDLSVSDTSISDWYDASGEVVAVQKTYRAIMRGLGAKPQITKNTDGAESTDYIKLLDLYNFYKKTLADYEEENAIDESTSTGVMVETKCVTIAGGNV